MSVNLDKQYEHGKMETRWYETWEKAGYFKAADSSDKPPFALVIPPPNVTGVLHMGHALTYTIQDTIIRWKRMQGHNTLWLPGTDHAGIATQMLVERMLQKERGIGRHDLGREKFLEEVWTWTRKHQGGITGQSRSLGISVDWERERFTLDEGLSKSVREAFVRLHDDGLLYRARRMVNWSPAVRTVLSDLEVVHKEVKGAFWHLAYPVEGEPDRVVVVATTRPETMLGDTAVAVHPDDPRYTDLIGKMLVLPLTGRRIPVIADPLLADMEKGTGAVKVTPAHDPNDFECGQRNNLPMVDIFNDDASLNENVPARFQGLDRFEARKAVVAELEAEGRLVKTEEMVHSVGHCMRSGVPVEPRVSWQWYVKMGPPEDEKSLACAALKAARDGDIRFVPERWTAEYYRWLEEIRDWCVSRQLWWGHRIPAWYCDCGEVIVSREDPTRCPLCGSTDLRQDEDVLDTWFSSALWPFSTLGWPEKTPALATFYPNSIMETGFDILFFWVARMVMMGIKLMGQPPFKDIYLHAMVRDEHGDKMSKTKGNVVDPLDVMKAHGADSMRFTLLSLTAQGRDIKFGLDRVEGSKAFMNKLWNASRFIFMNLEEDVVLPAPRDIQDRLRKEDKWILTRLGDLVRDTTKALAEYRFNDYANQCYRFVWNSFCDWYVELAKEALYGDDAQRKETVQAVLVHVLETALRVMHPVVPFITEELWTKLPGHRGPSVMISAWPTADEAFAQRSEADAFDRVLENLGAIRSIRSQNNLPPKAKVKVFLKPRAPEWAKVNADAEAYFVRLAGVEELVIDANLERPKETGALVTENAEVFVSLTGLVDFDAERERLRGAIKKLQDDMSGLERKLGNADFVAKAPEDVVEKQRARLDESREKIAGLEEHLKSLC